MYLWNKVTAGGEKKETEQIPQIKIKEAEKIEEARVESYRERVENLEKTLDEVLKELKYLREERKHKETEKEKEEGGQQDIKFKIPPPPVSAPPTPSLPPPPQPEKASEPQVQELRDLIGIEEGKEEIGFEKEEKEKDESEEEKVSVHFPAGSFVKAVLLSGVDAPAGGKAMANPQPVLLRITDRAVLPNLWKGDIRECFAVGSAYGDLSSERAYIRVETLSCIKKNGETLEKKIKAFVSGEDGKAGLRGRVVTRQGQILARSLIAGFLEGVAKAFRQTGTALIVTPQGAISTINPEDALEVGMFSGVGEAVKKLADFYMKLANQMFPVIEVNAGRRVEVVFLEGVKL